MSLSQVAQRALDAFAMVFQTPPQGAVQAPGRVNLIGEHTDYNDGWVLPCAIDRGTVIAVRKRNDMRVRVVAVDYGLEQDAFDLDAPILREDSPSWMHYIRGMAQQMVLGGHVVSGLDMAVSGNIPRGAGLSSSASLEVAVGQAFRFCGLLHPPGKTDLARMAQRAENVFVGCQCGIMDQLASACGQRDRALLIDCRSLEITPVELPRSASILIAHSMVHRGLVDSQYNARRMACEAAAKEMGVPALRDVTMSDLLRAELDDLTFRRARHVITENDRTLAAARVLGAGGSDAAHAEDDESRLRALGILMQQSHASMRDDFEITVPAIDELAHIVNHTLEGDGGARMTGGGFGGCVVALVPNDRLDDVRAAISHGYRSPGGEHAQVFVCSAQTGAGVLCLESNLVPAAAHDR
jgi:galactokinase